MRSSRLHSAHLLTALLSFFCFVFLLAQPAVAHAQNGTVTGTVTGYTGPGYPEVSAQLWGSMNVISADARPTYTLSLPPGQYTLSVTYPNSGWRSSPGYVTAVVTPRNTTYQNFTLSPINQTYVVSGTIFLPTSSCPGGQTSTTVEVELTGMGISKTTGAIVQSSNGQGTYSFIGVPFGTYTVTVPTANGVIGGSISTQSIPALNYNANLSLSRSAYNVCGKLLGYNGVGGPFFVGLSTLTQFNWRVATVQGDGTYTFQNVPVGFYQLNMGQTYPGYIVSPAYPFTQPAIVSGGDASNINFTLTANVSNVVGNITGLPNGVYESFSLYQWNGSAWSKQPIATTSTIGTYPFTFRNVPPGFYYVAPGPPPNPYGSITPLFLGAFQVVPGGQTVNAGTFNYTVSASASYGGKAWLTNANATFLLVPTVTLTVTGQYPGDVNTILLSNLNDYTQSRPLTFGGWTHPGAYSWRLTNLGNLRVNATSGSFSLAPGGFFALPDLKFTLPPGGNVRFEENGCGSAVCSGDPGSGADLKAGGIPQRISGSSAEKHPNSITTTRPLHNDEGTLAIACTAPITDAVKAAAKPSAAMPSGGAGGTGSSGGLGDGSSGGGTTTTPTCGSTVDITNVATIDFNGGFGPPDPNNPGYNLPDPTVPANNTTVTFSGVLYAAVDGGYQFQTTTNGPVTFAINGQTIIDNWFDSEQTQLGGIYLTGGQQYTYTMTYAYDDANSAAVNLSWQQPNDTSMNTIDQSFFASAPSLVPLQDLTLQQAGQIVDNYTTGDPIAQQSAIAAGYTVARVEGCAYPSPLPGTVSLDVYYNGSDYFTTTTDQTQPTPDSANYMLVGTAGYIFPTPLTDGSSIPLQTWNGNNDNFAAASQAGLDAAQQAGYVFLQTEGYVLPANTCQ